jgi:signal transduction histidine kinase
MAHRGGLGLMSMEECVHAVGGEFSIESSSGKGTTVRVQVPLNERN